MIGKLKKVLKILTMIFLVSVIVFGIYRREYLSQAIPVYIQYLEQRNKWENSNTKTYIYLFRHTTLISHYFFIKDNELLKTLRSNTSYHADDVKDKKYFAGGYPRDQLIEQKAYLIDERFNEIRKVLWKMLWNSNKYTVAIVYDEKYGYPLLVTKKYPKSKAKITLGFADGYNQKWSLHLKMFSKNTEYTNKLLQEVLDEYKLHIKKAHPEGKIRKEVGGGIIKGAIYDY